MVEKLITERGFNSVSVEDITNACGLAKGTFYVYFKHKEDIVREISRAPFAQMESDIQSMTDGLLQKLRYYFEKFMAGVERYRINICRQ